MPASYVRLRRTRGGLSSAAAAARLNNSARVRERHGREDFGKAGGDGMGVSAEIGRCADARVSERRVHIFPTCVRLFLTRSIAHCALPPRASVCTRADFSPPRHLQTSERKPVVVPVSSEKIVALAKDWMAGGTAAGISKTIVAPLGEELACASFLSPHAHPYASCSLECVARVDQTAAY